MMCDIPAIFAWCRPPWRGGVGLDAHVTHVPATIQPPREVGLAQESTR